jgi:phospholipid transport system substrate-binding protein
MRSITRLAALLLAATALPLVTAAPASAQAATPADAAAATKFVEDLSNRVFGLLKDKSVSQNALRGKFRGMMREAFALDEIGNKLIRRYRSQITPAQYGAYQTALPEFAINAYSDRLSDYGDADVQPVRTLPRGTKGDVDVYSRIVRPGSQPFDAVWTVRRVGGNFKIVNLTVAGINLSLTQEADFSAYIAKNGFDALVAFMKSANAKAAT